MRSLARVKRLEAKRKAELARCEVCGGLGRVVIVHGEQQADPVEGCPCCGRVLLVRVLREP